MARRRRTTAKRSRSTLRTSVSSSGRSRASTSFTIPGTTITWTVSHRAGHLPQVSVSTRSSSPRR